VLYEFQQFSLAYLCYVTTAAVYIVSNATVGPIGAGTGGVREQLLPNEIIGGATGTSC